MKAYLTEKIKQALSSFDIDGIYAAALIVDEVTEGTYPIECGWFVPDVEICFGSEAKYESEKTNEMASSEAEARWNIAFWLEEPNYIISGEEYAEKVIAWGRSEGLTHYEKEPPQSFGDILENEAEISAVRRVYINMLVGIVKQLHESGFIAECFGREIPILIQGYDIDVETIVDVIAANGEELADGFIKYVNEY